MNRRGQHPANAQDHPRGVGAFLRGLAGAHDHDHGPAGTDPQLESSSRGIWALKVSLLGLAATASFQVVVVLISSSVALLADTIHNFSDALTAVPLWIASVLGRRAATTRYTYGYGRAEDLAGVFIVLMIAASAGLAGWESIQRLISPQPISNLGWVMVAALVRFAGNDAVAVFRIRVGREIGSTVAGPPAGNRPRRRHHHGEHRAAPAELPWTVVYPNQTRSARRAAPHRSESLRR